MSQGASAAVHSRIQALQAKHTALSNELETARKRSSSPDFYLNQLKKEKLLVKEEIVELARANGTQH